MNFIQKQALALLPILLVCSIQGNANNAKKAALVDELHDYCNERQELYKAHTLIGISFPVIFSPIGISQKEAQEQGTRLTGAMKQGCQYLEQQLGYDEFIERLQSFDDENDNYGQSPFMHKLYDDLKWKYGKDKNNIALNEMMFERLELLSAVERLSQKAKENELE